MNDVGWEFFSKMKCLGGFVRKCHFVEMESFQGQEVVLMNLLWGFFLGP